MSERAVRVAAIAGLALSLMAARFAAAQARDVSRLESAIRQLERAAHPQRDGSHLPRILALRQLEDAALRPFYRDLTQRDDWQLQVHGALGLAETNDPPGLDVELASTIDGEAQAATVANALDLDLISTDGLRALASRTDVRPLPRLMAIGELLLQGEPVELGPLDPLAGDEELEVAGLATVLLAKTGDAGAMQRIDARLEELDRREREREVDYLVESIRQYDATNALAWVQAVADDASLGIETRYWAVHTLLELDPREGLAAVRNLLRADSSLRMQVRAATLLLASADELPAESAALLTDDHPLLEAARQAIRSFRDGGPSPAAVERLLDLEHMRTTRWILGAIDEWPRETQIALWEHMIETMRNDGPGRADRVARAVAASSQLMTLDPNRVVRRLLQAEDGTLEQEVLLMGMLAEKSELALEAARGLDRIGAGRADSLALLVIARNSDALSADELEMLGVVAAGGGRVSDGLQTQAAWLYVRHAGAAERALQRMKAKSSGD